MNEDARISKEGMLWHFQSIIDDARLLLKHRILQLLQSRDFDGNRHANNVTAIEAEMNRHFDEMEAFIRQKGQQA